MQGRVHAKYWYPLEPGFLGAGLRVPPARLHLRLTGKARLWVRVPGTGRHRNLSQPALLYDQKQNVHRIYEKSQCLLSKP
jgi:hypothetical protein